MVFKFLIFGAMATLYTSAFAEGILSYQQFERINRPNNPEAPDSWFQFSYIKKRDHGKSTSSALDLELRHLGGNAKNLYSVSEAYYMQDRGRTQLSYGRKNIDWMTMDKFWGLGHVNQMQGFSLMDEKQEGLIGLHLAHEGKIQVGLFASYLYVPQMNPGYYIQDGQVKGQTEWSRLPPTSIKFNDGTAPVYYELQMPNLSEIGMNESLGLMLGYNWNGGKVKGFGMYKPEGQARINATGEYQLDKDRALVKAKPFANHHMVAGAQADHHFLGLNWSAGLLYVRPMLNGDPNFQFQNLKFEPLYNEERYGLFQVELDRSYFKANVSYLKGEEKILKGAKDENNLFGGMPKWKNAIGAGLDFWVTDFWGFGGDWKMDMERQDRIFSQFVTAKFFKSAQVKAGMEVLVSPNNDSYWSQFRSNDTFFTNLSYIF